MFHHYRRCHGDRVSLHGDHRRYDRYAYRFRPSDYRHRYGHRVHRQIRTDCQCRLRRPVEC